MERMTEPGQAPMGTTGPGRVVDDDRVAQLEHTVASLREESEISQVLLGLSAALAKVRSAAETLESAVEMTTRIMGADRGFVASIDPAGGRLTLGAHSGFTDSELAPLLEEGRSDTGHTVLETALAQRSPVLVADAERDDRVSPADVGRGVRSCIAIPLVRWGDDFGALQIEYLEPRSFDARDVAVARGVALQLGVALANARQFSLFQGLRSFSMRIGRRLRMRPLIDEVARGAVRLLNADSGLVFFVDRSTNTLVPSARHGSAGAELAFFDLDSAPWSHLLEGEPLNTHDTARAPEVRASRCSVLAAPIPGRGDEILGAVLAVFEGTPTLGPDDGEALSVLAAHAGSAIRNARRFERQRRVARSLQAGLLRTELPALPNFELGTVYRPASGEADVGGDFFDIFDLPDGRYGVVVGDVSGKGAEAAAQTAMAKYMLRAFATREADPPSVLFHLNNALVQSMGEERFTTLVYGLLDPARKTLVLSSAGHPPPFLFRRAGNRVEALELTGGLLGAFMGQHYGAVPAQIETGDAVVFFTDGLTEVRQGTELYGRDRIARSIRELVPRANGAEAVAQGVFEAAERFGEITDDTVVLVLMCVSNDMEPEAGGDGAAAR